MSHKHVEAFFQRPRGWRDGRREVKEEGSVALTGLNAPYYCNLVFCNQEERGGVLVKSPHSIFSHSLAQLCCG